MRKTGGEDNKGNMNRKGDYDEWKAARLDNAYGKFCNPAINPSAATIQAIPHWFICTSDAH
jgi:hypothetical protein